MWARFVFFHFESRRISLEIYLTIPCHLSIVFYLIEAVVLDIFGLIHMTHKSHMFPFPTILVLRDTQVYVGSLNYCNMAPNIKTFIDKVFCSGTTLRVLDIDPNYSYI